MILDELKCYNSVSFKLMSSKRGGKSFFSHSVWNVFGILLRYSEAVAKCRGKQLYRSPFLNKVAGSRPIKKETPIVFFMNTSGRLLYKLSFFKSFLTVLYTHSRNNCNFSRKVYFLNNWALFAVHVWFLYHGAKVSWWA